MIRTGKFGPIPGSSKWNKAPRNSTHPGYRVACFDGSTFIMPKVWPQWEYELAQNEASAHGGIVVRANWKAAEPVVPFEDKTPVRGLHSSQQWLEDKASNGVFVPKQPK